MPLEWCIGLHAYADNIYFNRIILHNSRKRGPLSGAGFLCARDEASFLAITQAASPAVTNASAPPVCFLPGENIDAQPHVCIASYQKRFRGKGRVDKLANTIESDADFLAFQKQLNEPAEKLPSAEVQLEAKEKLAAIAQAAKDAFVKKETAKLKVLASKREKGRGSSNRTERAIRLAVAANLANKESAEAIKVNPLLQFMKEKAEKKSMERKLQLKEQAKKKVVTATTTPGGARGATSRDKDRDDSSKQSGKTKSGRDKEKTEKEKTVKEKSDKEKGRGGKDKADRGKKEVDVASNATVTKKPVTVLLKKRPEPPSESSSGKKDQPTTAIPPAAPTPITVGADVAPTTGKGKARGGKQKPDTKKATPDIKKAIPDTKKVTPPPAVSAGQEKGKPPLKGPKESTSKEGESGKKGSAGGTDRKKGKKGQSTTSDSTSQAQSQTQSQPAQKKKQNADSQTKQVVLDKSAASDTSSGGGKTPKMTAAEKKLAKKSAEQSSSDGKQKNNKNKANNQGPPTKGDSSKATKDLPPAPNRAGPPAAAQKPQSLQHSSQHHSQHPHTQRNAVYNNSSHDSVLRHDGGGFLPAQSQSQYSNSVHNAYQEPAHQQHHQQGGYQGVNRGSISYNNNMTGHYQQDYYQPQQQMNLNPNSAHFVPPPPPFTPPSHHSVPPNPHAAAFNPSSSTRR